MPAPSRAAPGPPAFTWQMRNGRLGALSVPYCMCDVYLVKELKAFVFLLLVNHFSIPLIFLIPPLTDLEELCHMLKIFYPGFSLVLIFFYSIFLLVGFKIFDIVNFGSLL